MPNIVHVVGTGTIGEPLIGLLDHAGDFGIDEVSFHKRTPMIEERAKVRDLVSRGAVLAVDDDRRVSFEEIGHTPKLDTVEAIERASVVIDCTPAGNANKVEFYEKAKGPRGFPGPGHASSASGEMYARGINDDALDHEGDRFVQVVSCNTHNISVLVKTLAMDGRQPRHLDRRSLPAACGARTTPQPGRVASSRLPGRASHDDPRFGTHHARDAWHLFQTLGYDLPLFSSAVKLNTQYMHCPALQPEARSRHHGDAAHRPPAARPIARIATDPQDDRPTRSTRSVATTGTTAASSPRRSYRSRRSPSATDTNWWASASPPGRQRPAVVDRSHAAVPARRCRRSPRVDPALPVPGGLAGTRSGRPEPPIRPGRSFRGRPDHPMIRPWRLVLARC